MKKFSFFAGFFLPLLTRIFSIPFKEESIAKGLAPFGLANLLILLACFWYRKKYSPEDSIFKMMAWTWFSALAFIGAYLIIASLLIMFVTISFTKTWL